MITVGTIKIAGCYHIICPQLCFQILVPHFRFFFFRGDGYCDKKEKVCKKKQKPGERCKLDSQCLNSICLEIQEEPVSQKGNHQGFGFRWVFIY